MSKSNKEDGFRSGSKNWPKKLFWSMCPARSSIRRTLSESVLSGSSERKVEGVSELRSRRVSQRFRLDVRDSTRNEYR
jgi:hypothetical protein